MRRLFPVLAALCLPFTAAAQPITPAERTAIERAVTSTLRETRVPSAQVAVVRDGQLVFQGAWGKAAEAIPQSRPDLPYQIASNSKQFIAALLLLLENDGKLSLDDPVSRWLPDVSGAERITLRHMLTHTSGLPDYWPHDFAFAATAEPVTPAGIVARWGRGPLEFEPGTRWEYSNTGYVVAAQIAEIAGGAPLWQQLEQRLFKPLGIRPLPLDDTNTAGFPQGYHRYATGPVRPAKPAARGWLWAAGELSMTAADLARWNIARINRELLPPEDWEQMETPARLADGSRTTYGLGVSRRTVGGRTRIDHGGESVGFLSQNTVWLDQRTAVTVLTNADYGGAENALTNRIAAIVLPKLPPVPARIADTGGRIDDIRQVLAGLASGQIDPARFTPNAQYYFSPAALGDYRTSLAGLGAPLSVTSTRTPWLRGGFVGRTYSVRYNGQRFRLSTYAEPGDAGRWEQFILYAD
ncbi:serine hydrolase [Novosphingobium sp.]|uniref:serine hydrolase domain-containing protein n=1 Tax=Novosphingobium sp. TaxID=1874826 RepID=UPI0027322FB6|nr:serine hydrolase domain-containing protein [Novosphingobium sp.]MDP3907907.1 serine hydrolase domain-containing protein [Novosphingobium sp.]